MLGYTRFENLPWADAFLNAAMLLGGMGPVNPPLTPAGKLFAGLYALYAGLVFIVTGALLFAPMFHRLMHLFHWSEKVQDAMHAPAISIERMSNQPCRPAAAHAEREAASDAPSPGRHQ